MMGCDEKYKPNTFFAPQIASGYGVYNQTIVSNRNKTRTLTRQLFVRLCAYLVSVLSDVDSESIRFYQQFQSECWKMDSVAPSSYYF